MVSAIERELCKVSKTPKMKSGGDRQEFLSTLVLAVSKIPDEDWEALSDDAADWAQRASAAKNNGEELPDFEDEGDEDGGETKLDKDEREETTGVEDEDKKPRRAGKSQKSKPAKEDEKMSSKKATTKSAKKSTNGSNEKSSRKTADAKTKSDDKKATTKSAKKREPKVPSELSKSKGIKVRIKMLLIKKPKSSADDLMEQLSKSGEPPSMHTVRAIRAEFRQTVKLLKEQGLVDLEV